jgi:hypothetical protein
MSQATAHLHALPNVGASSVAATARPEARRSRYLQFLTWAFTLFSSARLLSYLPTIWAIGASGDSSQHSLWTWGIWLGSNLTMALWLHEQNGQRWTRAALVNVVNAAMCAATLTVILVFRFG